MKKERTLGRMVQTRTKKFVSAVKDAATAHPLFSYIFILATLLTILSFQEKGFGGTVVLLMIALPCYCISAPILFYSIITRIVPNITRTVPKKETTTKKKAGLLHSSLWFLNTGVLTASFMVLLASGLLFIYSLLKLNYIRMLSALLITGICILIIFVSNGSYRYFEQKLNKIRSQRDKK